MPVNFETPILFQIFNSLDTTVRVFEEIKKISPQNLFIVQDGFRRNIAGEEQACLTVRETILRSIGWDCNLTTLFREENLGPGKGTAHALRWFFNKVDYGIFLEHDCLPHPDFFGYCANLLEYHKDDDRIKLINGSNFQMGRRYGTASYYFSASGQLWGLAGWKRSFANYTSDIKEVYYEILSSDIEITFKNKRVQNYWKNTYNKIRDGIVDTWDYQLMYTIWREKGLIIMPNVNLVSNIGFGENSLHCQNKSSPLSESKTYNILPLKHPAKVKRYYKSDINYYNNYLCTTPKKRTILKIRLRGILIKYFPNIAGRFFKKNLENEE